MCTNFWINPHNGKLPSRLAPAQCQNSLAPQLLSNINQSKSSLLIWHYVSYLFLYILWIILSYGNCFFCVCLFRIVSSLASAAARNRFPAAAVARPRKVFFFFFFFSICDWHHSGNVTSRHCDCQHKMGGPICWNDVWFSDQSWRKSAHLWEFVRSVGSVCGSARLWDWPCLWVLQIYS